MNNPRRIRTVYNSLNIMRAFGSGSEKNTTADWRIPLTNKGREQARLAGQKVDSLLRVNANGEELSEKGKVYFYVSPYLRTRQTLREILREVDQNSIIGIREDPRM